MQSLVLSRNSWVLAKDTPTLKLEFDRWWLDVINANKCVPLPRLECYL